MKEKKSASLFSSKIIFTMIVTAIFSFLAGGYSMHTQKNETDTSSPVNWEAYVDYITAPWNTYVNTEYGFSVRYPYEMKVREYIPAKYLFEMFVDPGEERAFSTIRVRECDDLNTAVEERRSEIEAEGDVIYYEQRATTVDSHPAYYMSYSNTFGDAEYIIQRNNYCYFVLAPPYAGTALTISTFSFLE